MIRDAAGRFGHTPALIIVVCAAVSVALLSVASGAYPLAIPDILKVLGGREASDPVASLVLLEVRMPRFLLGFLVGAVLAVSGALLQGLFRNPLADPGLIGVSAGASLAAIMVIVLGSTWLGEWLEFAGEWALPIAAFFGGSATVFLAWRIANRGGQTQVATLLLSGIAINAIAGAATGLLTFYATDDELRSLTFWTMGSLGHAGWDELVIGAPFMILALIVSPFLARPLDAFLLGESVVGHLGYPANTVKKAAILVVGLGVGAAVAVSGLIGFVGLVVPHLVRLVLGASHRVVLPFSALIGGTLLVAADSLARILVAPAELPIGLMMALIGGPFFLGLLMRRKIV